MFKGIRVGSHVIDAPGISLWEEFVLVRGENENPKVENLSGVAEVELVEVSIYGGRVPKLNLDEDPVLSEIRFMIWR